MPSGTSLGLALRSGVPGHAERLRRPTKDPQIPHASAAIILVRVDGAGATHDLLTHLEALNTTRRTVRYTVGWKIGEADEQAIAKLPEAAWETSLHQDTIRLDGAPSHAAGSPLDDVSKVWNALYAVVDGLAGGCWTRFFRAVER